MKWRRSFAERVGIGRRMTPGSAGGRTAVVAPAPRDQPPVQASNVANPTVLVDVEGNHRIFMSADDDWSGDASIDMSSPNGSTIYLRMDTDDFEPDVFAQTQLTQSYVGGFYQLQNAISLGDDDYSSTVESRAFRTSGGDVGALLFVSGTQTSPTVVVDEFIAQCGEDGQAFFGMIVGGIYVLWVGRDSGVPKVSFFNATPAAKQTVTGSKGGNAALASLIAALAAYGLITDSTT